MLRRFLTPEEQRTLLTTPRDQRGPLAQRDYLWMKLLLETGMRIGELETMTAGQARDALQRGWLVVHAEQRKANRKGQRRGHEYMVTEPVREALQGLLMLHAQGARDWPDLEGEHAPLLWGRYGDAMTRRNYEDRMKLWARKAGLDSRISPHWLRHSRGKNIVANSRAQNPLKVVQQALGHVSIASTGIYTQLDRGEFEQALQNTAGAGGRMRKAEARRAAAKQTPPTTGEAS